MNTPLVSQTFEDRCYSQFGSKALLRYLEAFESGIGGVIQNRDIEYVHKTRVASRKLRATLPLFRSCFSEKTYKKSLKTIKKATRLLGAARDLDVEICFVEQYQKTLDVAQKAGIGVLLTELKAKRSGLQKSITKGLQKMEAPSSLTDLKMVCTKTTAEVTSELDKSRLIEKSRWSIAIVLDELLSMHRYVNQEAAEQKHHEMRIYAKKLRYTMETFAPLYEDQLDEEVKTVRAFQDLLGEMHDYDVWMAQIQNSCNTQTLQSAADKQYRQALMEFSAYLKETRKVKYNEFAALWNENKKNGFFRDLKKLTAAKVPVKTADDLTLERKRMVEASEEFSHKCWPDNGHHTQVRGLAVQLFDNLAATHKLCARERCWLECAAILHDIGLSVGSGAHHKKSAELILEDITLPFTPQDRLVIASIARYHRKGLPKEKHQNLAALDPVTRGKVKTLAGLLRVADSLDYTHNSAVKTLHVKEKQQIMIVECDGKESSLVEQAFNKKKDLFEITFKRKLMLLWKTA